jgi:hypothetical protein
VHLFISVGVKARVCKFVHMLSTSTPDFTCLAAIVNK